jgi:hypothetical protein
MAGAKKSGKHGWKLDEEFDFRPESKEFLKLFKQFVTTNYGKRCKRKCNVCGVCSMWALYDLVELSMF